MSTTLRLTVDEYDRMVECGAFDHLQRKIELLRGELREDMSPAGPVHNWLIMYLINWSGDVRTDDIIVSSQTGLKLLESDSRPEPDLVWLANKNYRNSHPTGNDVRLAIEVSQSSLKTDLRDKASIYAEAMICEYWVVDAVENCIHVYRQPANGEYTDKTIIKPGEPLSPLSIPNASLDVTALFAA